jgi:hypothetical protein
VADPSEIDKMLIFHLSLVKYFGRHERAFRYKSSTVSASPQLLAGFTLQSLADFRVGKSTSAQNRFSRVEHRNIAYREHF